jgi:hypothetical protein
LPWNIDIKIFMLLVIWFMLETRLLVDSLIYLTYIAKLYIFSAKELCYFSEIISEECAWTDFILTNSKDKKPTLTLIF